MLVFIETLRFLWYMVCLCFTADSQLAQPSCNNYLFVTQITFHLLCMFLYIYILYLYSGKVYAKIYYSQKYMYHIHFDEFVYFHLHDSSTTAFLHHIPLVLAVVVDQIVWKQRHKTRHLERVSLSGEL